jgi:hypothetical protein
MSFAENLAALPATDHLTAVELTGPGGEVVRIDNIPGSQGSVRVYAYLLGEHGAIDAGVAAEGLTLYAEHTADARAFPGKHPNIDRLLAILDDGQAWRGQAV